MTFRCRLENIMKFMFLMFFIIEFQAVRKIHKGLTEIVLHGNGSIQFVRKFEVSEALS